FDHIFQVFGGELYLKLVAIAGLPDGSEFSHSIDVALNKMSRQSISQSERALQIHASARRELAQNCPMACLSTHKKSEDALARDSGHCKTNAIDRNAFTEHGIVIGRADCEDPLIGLCFDFCDRAKPTHYTCEHAYSRKTRSGKPVPR